MILPIILAGGYGERLWPLSRELHPKQFLAVNSSNSLLQDSLLRLPNNSSILPPIIVCHEEHRFLVAEQLRQKDIKTTAILLEPIAKNTALAIGVAALWAKKQAINATLLVLPADHIIKAHEQFHQAINNAHNIAKLGHLVTFGITPTYAETGYGYISKGAAIENTTGFHIKSFTEKPKLAHAEALIFANDTFWNSGMFMFQTDTILAELKQYQPELFNIAKQASDNYVADLDFIRLQQKFYLPAQNLSIDHAIMEKTSKAAVTPLNAAWCDIGNWHSLWKHSDKDHNNNLIYGDAITIDTKNCLIDAREQIVTTIGIENLIITATKDAILISQQEKAQRVKEIVQLLKAKNPLLTTQPCKVVRPWGWFESIVKEDRFQVKRIVLEHNKSISLQLHHHRSEHWIVVKGTARITKGNEVSLLAENQSTYIPIGTKHRLENAGKVPLEIIEIQSGSYLEEDDIVRFQDQYGRITNIAQENA